MDSDYEEDIYTMDDDMMDDYDHNDDHDNTDSGDDHHDSEPQLADDASKKSSSYLTLKKEDLSERLNNDINEVMSVLSINKHDACMLLIRYNWSVFKVHEAWFDNEFKVRESVGLLDVDPDVKFPTTSKKRISCGICFESVRVKDTANCGCGHSFCKVCWTSYVSTSIDGGIGCLTLKCPEPKCGAAVGPDMVKVIVKGHKKTKRYNRFVVMSYVECLKKVKWCPGPGCEYVVEFDEDDHDIETGDDDYDVYCGCKYGFCWKCLEDAHRPLDCDTVAKWMIKNSSEAENTNWILKYTKPCPNCKKSIEKNEGCMHMTCKCGHHFCWLCLQSLRDHHGCNRYKGHAKTKEDVTRERAKNSMVKYTHYYERWAANEKSRKKALSDLEDIKSNRLEKIGSTYHQNVTQLQFIEEAWLQIVKCRRILKWTYAYGYYIPENEEGKKNMFEYLQGEAEGVLERLHHCAEKELKSDIRLTNFGDAIKAFNEFRQKLATLTKVTKSYFENLVTALKKGLPEVWLDEKSWNADNVLGETDLFNL